MRGFLLSGATNRNQRWGDPDREGPTREKTPNTGKRRQRGPGLPTCEPTPGKKSKIPERGRVKTKKNKKSARLVALNSQTGQGWGPE